MTKTIEQLQARVRELEWENVKLKAESRDACLGLSDYYGSKLAAAQEENAHWQKATAENENKWIDACDQLAAAQLNNKLLRKALETLNKVSNIGCDLVEKALASPSDTSSLDAYVAQKVKELSDEHRRATLIRYEQTAEIIRQRDLAVEALKSCGVNDGLNGPTQYFDEDLVERAIKESDGM